MAHLQITLPDGSSQQHELTEEKTTIGRVEDNVLIIVHDSVSSHHAEIVQEGDTCTLRDLGSTNGTFINGDPVTESVLKDGIEIRLGAVSVRFVSADQVSGGTAQPLPRSAAPATEVANLSSRPENFVCSSPIARNAVKKDPIALVAAVVGVLGLVTVLAGAVMALTLSV